MTRVVYFTAATLDGFIADEDHSLDWLLEVPHAEDDSSWDDFIAGIEIQLGLTPVVLGAGAPLLPRRITSQRLRLRDARRAGQRVRLVLDVLPPDQA